jgi:hypothetical protein
VPFREENPDSGEALELELFTRDHYPHEEMTGHWGKVLARLADSQKAWLLRRGPIEGPMPETDWIGLEGRMQIKKNLISIGSIP